MRFQDRLRMMLASRYGKDELNRFLTVIFIILLVLGVVARFVLFPANVVFLPALALMIYINFRALSGNHAKRTEENQRYLDIKRGLFGGLAFRKKKKADPEHAYFKCPKCRKKLRVPRGKGRISIHCPQCGTDFIKTT